MMFEQNFMPEGAEINPDTPRKKGLARLFEILSRDLDGIFLSGALAMLVCVPAAILAGIALCGCACWRRSPPGGWWVRL